MELYADPKDPFTMIAMIVTMAFEGATIKWISLQDILASEKKWKWTTGRESRGLSPLGRYLPTSVIFVTAGWPWPLSQYDFSSTTIAEWR